MEVTIEDKVELLMDAVNELQVKAAVYDDPEVDACRRVYEALSGLPLDAVERVLWWAGDKLKQDHRDGVVVPKEHMKALFQWLDSDFTGKEFRAKQQAEALNEADVSLL